jgi:hypothetical protein
MLEIIKKYNRLIDSLDAYLITEHGESERSYCCEKQISYDEDNEVFTISLIDSSTGGCDVSFYDVSPQDLSKLIYRKITKLIVKNMAFKIKKSPL